MKEERWICPWCAKKVYIQKNHFGNCKLKPLDGKKRLNHPSATTRPFQNGVRVPK